MKAIKQFILNKKLFISFLINVFSKVTRKSLQTKKLISFQSSSI